MMRFTSLDSLLNVRRQPAEINPPHALHQIGWQFVHTTRANTPAEDKS
jgi:hypothetical protein